MYMLFFNAINVHCHALNRLIRFGRKKSPKIQILLCLLGKEKVNPQCCILSEAGEESADHVSLHSPFTLQLMQVG